MKGHLAHCKLLIESCKLPASFNNLQCGQTNNKPIPLGSMSESPQVDKLDLSENELLRFKKIDYEQPTFHGSATEVYNQILGLNSNRMPSLSNLPEEIILPPAVYGNFINSTPPTVQQFTQPNQPSHLLKEESQLVFWNKKHQQFNYDQVYMGAIGHASLDYSRKTEINNLFGNKSILNYHTHPNNSSFSDNDLFLSISKPRTAYMDLVGSHAFGALMVQTEKAARFQISSILQEIHLGKELNKLFGEQPRILDPIITTEQYGKFLQENNYGYYVYTPQIQLDGVVLDREFLAYAPKDIIELIKNKGLRLMRWDKAPINILHKYNTFVR